MGLRRINPPLSRTAAMGKGSKPAFFFAALLCLCTPFNATAQEARATLRGRVVDPQGAIVPSATVAVTSDDTGVKYQRATNTQGNWLVEFLLPGHYRISVTKPGFRAANRPGIELQTADDKEIDVQLEVGAYGDQLERIGGSTTATVP